jgi:hypothetical protein
LQNPLSSKIAWRALPCGELLAQGGYHARLFERRSMQDDLAANDVAANERPAALQLVAGRAA